MSDNGKKDFDINSMRDKVKSSQSSNGQKQVSPSLFEPDTGGFSWSAVASQSLSSVGQHESSDALLKIADPLASKGIDFGGKNLAEGKFSGENFENANFSAANLTGVDFTGANLKGTDLSGAILTDANLSGADLSGAVLTGAQLVRTNFTGANLKGVVLTDADIQDAILLDIAIDDIGLEELQSLIEYLAKYFPHKLNLQRLNLTLLDLSKIDLKNVNLRGVDFTGVDFTGVNIMELDLSECIITPQQIAQALGRVPNAEELKRIMAPKKKKAKANQGIDMTDFFLGDATNYGIWDTTKDFTSIDQLLDVGKKVFRRSAKRPDVKDAELLEKIKTETNSEEKNHNAELRKVIEERKRQELEARKEKKREFQNEVIKENSRETQEKPAANVNRHVAERMMSSRDRSRD